MLNFRKPRFRRPDPQGTLDLVRQVIRSGQRLPLDRLTPAEMAAAGELIRLGEAEIGSAACRPILKAKLG